VSIRQIQREWGIPKSTAHGILMTHNCYPYHIALTQDLIPDDFRRGLVFCNWYFVTLTMLQRDRSSFFRYVFSDEVTFHNTGQLNRHSSHYWAVETLPKGNRQVNHQHRWNLIVWCGIANGYLISLYFFNENRFNYLHFSQHELIRLLENIDLETSQCGFNKMVHLRAHLSRIVRDHLNLTFPDKWIGHYGPIAWCS